MSLIFLSHPQGFRGRLWRALLKPLRVWFPRPSKAPALPSQPTHPADTELHPALAASSGSEGLQELMDGLPPAIVWSAHPDSRIEDPIEHGLATVGAEMDGLIGRSWLELVHAPDRAHARQIWDEAVATGRAFSLECRLLRDGGSYRWCAISGVPVQQASFEGLRWICVGCDIHDLKDTRFKLAEIECRYTALFNNQLNGIAHLRVVTNEQGQPVDVIHLQVNTAYEDIVGIKKADIEGRRGREIFPGIEKLENNVIARFGRIAVEGGEELFEYDFPYTQQWFSIYAYQPLPGECTVIFTDITLRKRAQQALEASEARLAEAGHELEHRVEERTRELEVARQRAEEARRSAEAANRAKTDFLATMSHEIRTPLNGVIGFNALLLDGPLTEEKRHYAEFARQSGESLLHLLNDFLDYSKIDAGHLVLEPVDFSPEDEVHQVVSLVQSSAQQKNILLEWHIDSPPCVQGDAARLRQILLNLLSNAVKFTQRGKITLSCEELSHEGDTTWLAFKVIDTGIGIATDVQDRLFLPFVQADASTTRRYGGTGLGLTICKCLAETMGGSIGVQSRLGEGSTFWVNLPFTLRSVMALAERAADFPVSPAAGQQVGRILVAEDNPVSQKLTLAMLHNLGYATDLVDNGQAAVAACKHTAYDLVLMDCDMPVMNGFDAASAIRDQAPRDRHVPIVAVTAAVIQGTAERCISAGMDDFMSKPLRLQPLAQMVNKWLRRSKPDVLRAGPRPE